MMNEKMNCECGKVILYIHAVWVDHKPAMCADCAGKEIKRLKAKNTELRNTTEGHLMAKIIALKENLDACENENLDLRNQIEAYKNQDVIAKQLVNDAIWIMNIEQIGAFYGARPFLEMDYSDYEPEDTDE